MFLESRFTNFPTNGLESERNKLTKLNFVPLFICFTIDSDEPQFKKHHDSIKISEQRKINYSFSISPFILYSYLESE